MKKSFSPEFMAKVALAAIKEEATIAELSSKYEVHRTQIGNWATIIVSAISSFPRRRESRNRCYRKDWIPAFAGMTFMVAEFMINARIHNPALTHEQIGQRRSVVFSVRSYLLLCSDPPLPSPLPGKHPEVHVF